MGRSSSKELASPPPELNKHWREINWSKTTTMDILKELADVEAQTNVLRILLYGPVGAGKSCFLNSVQRILLGRNVFSALERSSATGQSFTVTIKTHKLRKREGGHYAFALVDTMGIESNENGINTADIFKVLDGHILDGYEFNSMQAIEDNNPKYNKNPKLCDKIHCVVNIVSASSVTRMDDTVFKQMNSVRAKASKLGIPQVIVATKVDEACEIVNEDLKKIYLSTKIKQKMEECSNRLNIPLNNIYPVKNYYSDITQDQDTDVLLSMALRDIVNFANDYVEGLKNIDAK